MDLLTIFLGAIVLVVVLLVARRFGPAGILSSSRDGPIVILGPSLSGKTSLFLALLHHQWAPVKARTVMSAVANRSVMSFESRADVADPAKAAMTFSVVDYAGHHKLRRAVFEGIDRETPRGIVFVFDASAPSYADFAEYTAGGVTCRFLVQVLGRVEAKGVPLLMLCNKIDRKKTPLSVVKARLDAELARHNREGRGRDQAREDNLLLDNACSFTKDSIDALPAVTWLSGDASEKNAQGEITLADASVEGVERWIAAQ